MEVACLPRFRFKSGEKKRRITIPRPTLRRLAAKRRMFTRAIREGAHRLQSAGVLKERINGHLDTLRQQVSQIDSYVATLSPYPAH